MLGLAATFIAIAVILMAVVSLMTTGMRRQAVLEGRATAADLSELSGIFDPRVLQDVFGPPTLDGVFRTDMARIKQVRRRLAYLISDDRLDMLTIAIAVLSFFIRAPLMELLLVATAVYQIAGFIALPRLRQK